MPAVNVDNIPYELKEYNQWVTWIMSPEEKKIPLNPHDRGPGKVDNDRTWGSFGQVSKVYPNNMGFVFTANDPYVGIDLDKCRNKETEELTQEAQDIVDLLESYTEISQSGTGLHIIVKAKIPKALKQAGLEIYTTGRYFIFTGDHLPGTPCEINERQHELDRLIEDHTEHPEHTEEKIKIKKGGRNNALTRIAGRMRRDGAIEEEILARLLRENAELEEPLPEKEVRTIAASVSRYPEGKPKKERQMPAREEGWKGELTGHWKETGSASFFVYDKTTYNAKIMARNLRKLSFNAFTLDVVVDGEPIDDTIIVNLMADIGKEFQMEFSKNLVSDAMVAVAREYPVNPVRASLESMYAHWDGVPRLTNWLQQYVGVVIPEETQGYQEYLEFISVSFFVSIVARVFEPGCKVDTMLVLEGGQGTFKSTLAKTISDAICPNHFSDALPSIRFCHKEAIMHLRGKLIIEIAELAKIKGSAIESVKSFITGQGDFIRLPYNRCDTQVKRSCVFFGTTNDDDWLEDTTGGRRYYPVKLADRADLTELKIVLPQLLGEAVHRYSAGENWWIDERKCPEVARVAKEVVEERMVWDTIADTLLPYAQWSTEGFKLSQYFASEEVPLAQRTDSLSRRCGKILRKAGYQLKSKRVDGEVMKMWKK